MEPEAPLRHGAVRHGVEVHLRPEVLPGGEQPHGAGRPLRSARVAVVIRRVLLGAAERRADERELHAERRDGQAQEGDMAGGQVPHLVIDDEAQRLRVPRRASHLEQVGVDDDVAAEPVPGGEGVDLPVAEHDIGVRHAPQPEAVRGLDHHPVPLGELGEAHLHPLRALLRVQDGAHHPQDDRDDGHEEEVLADGAHDERAHIRLGAGGFGDRDQPCDEAEPRGVGAQGQQAADRHERELLGVAQRADPEPSVDGRPVEQGGRLHRRLGHLGGLGGGDHAGRGARRRALGGAGRRRARHGALGRLPIKGRAGGRPGEGLVCHTQHRNGRPCAGRSSWRRIRRWRTSAWGRGGEGMARSQREEGVVLSATMLPP